MISMSWLKRFRTQLVPVILCLAVTALTSCGPPPRATVTGTVTLGNKPLNGGTVTFVAAKNLLGSGIINPDGTYTVADAPVGDVTITVTTPDMPRGPVPQQISPPGTKMPADMQPGGTQGGMNVKLIPAPEKYRTPETSPLKFTVQKGSQTHPIELEP